VTRGDTTAVAVVLTAATLFVGCAAAVGPACEISAGPYPLPPELAESSGVAWGLRNADVVWTVADGRADRVWALNTEGTIVAEVPVVLPGVWDVEDLAVAPCEAGACLLLADVGDNALTRDSLVVWQFAEPQVLPASDALYAPVTDVAAWVLRYPGEAHDVEAMFIDGQGRIRLVSKGVDRPVRHFRGPVIAGRVGGEGVLEEVQTFGDGPRLLANQVTGASAIPGTDRVVLRTYRDLLLYRLEGEVLVPVEGGVESLLPLREPQGEAVSSDRGGRVVLTSEAGPLGRAGGMHLLSCPGLVE